MAAGVRASSCRSRYQAIVGRPVAQVVQVGLVAVADVEQIAEHLDRVPLLPVAAEQRRHRQFEVLTQQVEQGRLDRGNNVDGGADPAVIRRGDPGGYAGKPHDGGREPARQQLHSRRSVQRGIERHVTAGHDLRQSQPRQLMELTGARRLLDVELESATSELVGHSRHRQLGCDQVGDEPGPQPPDATLIAQRHQGGKHDSPP